MQFARQNKPPFDTALRPVVQARDGRLSRTPIGPTKTTVIPSRGKAACWIPKCDRDPSHSCFSAAWKIARHFPAMMLPPWDSDKKCNRPPPVPSAPQLLRHRLSRGREQPEALIGIVEDSLYSAAMKSIISRNTVILARFNSMMVSNAASGKIYAARVCDSELCCERQKSLFEPLSATGCSHRYGCNWSTRQNFNDIRWRYWKTSGAGRDNCYRQVLHGHHSGQHTACITWAFSRHWNPQ